MSEKPRTSRGHPRSAARGEVIDELDYSAQGGWITAVERLVRCLKNNDCNEYAQPLSREAKSFHLPPTDRHRERRALVNILDWLEYLRSQPPTDLKARQREILTRHIRAATASVKYRLKELPRAIEGERNAVLGATEWVIANLPPDGRLSQQEYGILHALFDREAFDPESRITTADIAKQLAGAKANAATLKQPVSGLRHKRLIDTMGGRSGGCWLTESGKGFIEQARKS
jgi:hypothetical protein